MIKTSLNYLENEQNAFPNFVDSITPKDSPLKVVGKEKHSEKFKNSDN